MIESVIKDSIKIIGIDNDYPNNSRCFKKVNIEVNLILPKIKPCILNIISCMADVIITKSELINTSIATSLEGQIITGNLLLVEGLIKENIEYAAEETQIVHGVKFNSPFSTYLMLPSDFLKEVPVSITGYIEDINLTILDKKTIYQNITLFINGSLYY